jgi:hypothetical protein
VKKSKLSRNVAPEYCAERRYVSLATALAVASMANKVTTVDTGNMISNSGRKEIRTKGRENHQLKRKCGKNARLRNVLVKFNISIERGLELCLRQ